MKSMRASHAGPGAVTAAVLKVWAGNIQHAAIHPRFPDSAAAAGAASAFHAMAWHPIHLPARPAPTTIALHRRAPAARSAACPCPARPRRSTIAHHPTGLRLCTTHAIPGADRPLPPDRREPPPQADSPQGTAWPRSAKEGRPAATGRTDMPPAPSAGSADTGLRVARVSRACVQCRKSRHAPRTPALPPGNEKARSLAARAFLQYGARSQIRLNTSVPLVPPKPKLFFTATSILASRAVLAQ